MNLQIRVLTEKISSWTKNHNIISIFIIGFTISIFSWFIFKSLRITDNFLIYMILTFCFLLLACFIYLLLKKEISNRNTRFFIIVMIALFIVVRSFYMIKFSSIMVIDESLYISTARSLFTEFNLSYQGQPAVIDKIVYPLVLAPIYALHGLFPTMVLIRVYGIIIFSIGFIPVFLLSKDVVKSNSKAILILSLTMLMPDMFYGGFASQEVTHFPLMMFMFYLFYKTITVDKKRNFIVLGVILSILTENKSIGIVGLISFVIFTLFIEFPFFQKLKNLKVTMKKIVITLIPYIIIKIVMSGTLNILRASSNYSDSLKTETPIKKILDIFLKDMFSNFKVLISLELKYIFYILIAFSIIPVIFCLIGFLNFNKNQRKLFIFTSLYLFLTVSVVIFMIYLVETGSFNFQRVHMRYLYYGFIPILILFVSMTDLKIKVRWHSLIIPLFIGIYFLKNIGNIKVENGSRYDNLSLHFFNYIIEFENKKVLFFGLICVLITILINNRKIIFSKQIMFYILMGILTIQLFQNYHYMKFINIEKSLESKDFYQINETLENKKEVLLLNSASLYNVDDFMFNRLDATLNYNYQSTTYLDLVNYADSLGKVNLASIIPCSNSYKNSVFTLGEIQYIVTHNEEGLDYKFKNTKKIKEDSIFFDIFQIENSCLEFNYVAKFKNGSQNINTDDEIIFFAKEYINENTAKIHLLIQKDKNASVNSISFYDSTNNKNSFPLSIGDNDIYIIINKNINENAYSFTFELIGNNSNQTGISIKSIEPY